MDVEQHKADCLRRFYAAVRDGRSDDYIKSQTIVHDVRHKHGDKAAMVAKRELFKFIRSDKGTNATAAARTSEESTESPQVVKRGGRTVRIR